MPESANGHTEALVVVGNGFDLHHGLSTKFEDFKRYLERRSTGYDDQVERIETYLCELRGDWANLEEALASLDVETLRDHAADFLMPYGAEDWSDAFHHDYQYEMEKEIEALSNQLVEELADWIDSVPIPNPHHTPRLLEIDPASRFLSFNYTRTLERLYRVDPRRVLYVHGATGSDAGPIVLGHAWKQEPAEGPAEEGDEQWERDPRVQEGERIIQRYFADTFKPTADILERHRAFFDSLSDVEEVYVWGHSLSPVDLPYFKMIVAATYKASPRWFVSYHSDEEKARHTDVLKNIGLEAERIDLRPLSEFRRTSYPGQVVEGDLGTLWNG